MVQRHSLVSLQFFGVCILRLNTSIERLLEVRTHSNIFNRIEGPKSHRFNIPIPSIDKETSCSGEIAELGGCYYMSVDENSPRYKENHVAIVNMKCYRVVDRQI
ncbi:hypothetical protein CEXT_461751 [Caerostris extrusa]|uniref:Uncharacterized protein n=1 Tax=Caerostris extrusa TaxID=172846 RepID=A0AAV4QPF0_CAEEX|nr:hypothetical protein CEXT_461751 [Caerostris extrusa]